MKEEEENEGMMPRINDVAKYRQHASVLILSLYLQKCHQVLSFLFIYINATISL